MAFFRGSVALFALGRSNEATPNYGYYGAADQPPTHTYYSSSHNYYGGSKHISADETPSHYYYDGSKHNSADETPTCGFQGKVCSFSSGIGGVYDPVGLGLGGGLNGGLNGGGGFFSVPGGVYPDPGLLWSGGGGLYPVPWSGGGGLYPVPWSGGGGLYPVPGGGGGQHPVPGGGDGQYPVPGGGDGQYPVPGGGDGLYPVPGGGDGQYPVGLFPDPGLGGWTSGSTGSEGGFILDGTCHDSRGCADDGLPGIPLSAAQLALVQKMASQAADGLSTTIQLLKQDQQSGPVGNLFEQIFSDKLSKNLADEKFVQDRLQDVLNMMRTHPDRIKYTYCTEGEGGFDCPEDQGVVAFVVSGGNFGETDETEFTVHLGKIWWDAIEEWGEGCKAGVLIHEYTHHIFHTQDLGYNHEGKVLTDEQKKQNAAAYQNLVVEVMVARQKHEL